jgi:predicted  nucleic acid-binding Zn-ribbon protein
MSRVYKGEYIDTETAFIGEKIEKGFSLLRDQLSLMDNSDQLTAINNTLCDGLNTIRSQLSQIRSDSAHRGIKIEELVVKIGTLSRNVRAIVNALAPEPTIVEEVRAVEEKKDELTKKEAS